LAEVLVHSVDPAPSHRTACLACGEELVYLPEAQGMRCAGCQRSFESHARCARGHFYCDACHSSDAMEVIERLCLHSEETDPAALTRAVMHHPALKMHGPEHHFLTPAALLAAWCNLRGEPEERKASLLTEARRRATQVPGGACGAWGACGAAIGAGIFVSVVTGATPRSREPWALSQAMTAEVLGVLARLGGPRCCKRNTWLATLAAAKFSGKHLGAPMPTRGAPCDFSPMNPDCHTEHCPFYPRAALPSHSPSEVSP
jgi:hypothetical protein